MSQSRRKQQFKEYLYIATLTGIILATTPTVLRILTRAWNSEGVTYNLIWGIGHTIGNTDTVFIYPVTLFVGLIMVFCLDRMKKIQAFILVIGAGYAVITLLQQGMLIENVAWLKNIPVVIVGLLSGLYLGGGKKLLDETWPHEFRKAPSRIWVILAIVVVIGLLELHIGYQNPIGYTENGITISGASLTPIGVKSVGLFGNVAYSTALLLVVKRFTEYDLQRSFTVLGPKRGGKTTLMTGAFHSANDMTNGNASASDKLIEYRQNLMSADEGFGRIDNPTEASETYELWFNYDYGEYLKKNIEVEAIDHGGEVLLDIKDEIDKLNAQTWTSSVSNLRSWFRDVLYGAETDSSTFRSQAHEKVARSITQSDSLVITIPVDDFIEDNLSPENVPDYYTSETDRSSGPLRPSPAEYLAEYDKILDWFTNTKQSDVIIVITMADLALEEFKEQRLNGNEMTTEEEYLRFEHWIKSELIGPELDRLQDYTDEETPLSVHFKMNRDQPVLEDDRLMPNPQLAGGNIEFVGGKRLLRKLGE